MLSNFKKRIYTSAVLLLLLVFTLIYNFILGYLLIIIGIFSILEFSNLTKIIFKKDKFKNFISNVIFIFYIFSFISLFLIASMFLHLKVLIFVILLTCIFSDIGGYVFGKIFGGKKLTKISPNKTISGFFGSLFLSVFALFFLVYILTKNFELGFFIVGIVTSIACQIGDLFFSYLKRKSKLDDTGNILPGHGGILDRVDGILLGLPVGIFSLLTFF